MLDKSNIGIELEFSLSLSTISNVVAGPRVNILAECAPPGGREINKLSKISGEEIRRGEGRRDGAERVGGERKGAKREGVKREWCK